MSKEKLEQNGCEKETLTIKECIDRLETHIKIDLLM